MEIKQATGKFGRIGVLMGGPSTEREISLKSGKAVLKALLQEGIEAIAIDIETDDININKELLKAKNIDCAFLALHGHFGEDGSMQEILEELNIPYTGSGVRASRLAMDKIASREIFASCGLPVPRYKILRHHGSGAGVDLGLPLVIKPSGHGSSIGLSIINDQRDLSKAVELAFNYDQNVILEEYIKGREITVGILEEEPLAVIEIITQRPFFDYEAKYAPGLTDYVVPARLEECVVKKSQETALKAHKLLDCFGCSRVDMIINEKGMPYILEVNTIPGLTDTSLLPKAAGAHGIDFTQLCLKLIKLAYEKKKGLPSQAR